MSDEDSKVPLPDLENSGEMQTIDDAGALAPPESDAFTRGASDLEALFDVPVKVSAVLGHALMDVSELLKLGPGALLELDRKVGEAIDIYVNDRPVACGVTNDACAAVRAIHAGAKEYIPLPPNPDLIAAALAAVPTTAAR